MNIPTTKSNIQLDLLHPWFVKRLEAFFADPRISGKVKINSGCRSYATQAGYYKKYKAGTGNLAANPDRRFGEKGLDGLGIWRGSWHMQQLDGWCYAVDLALVGKGITTGDVNRIATEYGIRPTVASEWWHHQPRKAVDWFPAPAMGDNDPALGGVVEKSEQLFTPAEVKVAEPVMDWAGILAAIAMQREEIVKSPLKRGSKGGAVKTSQSCLGNLGYECGIADGIYGRKTTAAVKKFQKATRLSISGSVDSATFDAFWDTKK